MFVVLTFAAGPERGECLAVSRGDRLTIGRSSKAGRKIKDTHLSRIHLEVDYSVGDQAKVRDLDSRNGIYINGRKFKERGLGQNDRLLAGQQVWDVSYVSDLTELDDEAEETMAFFDKPKECKHCDRPISLATFADGEVLEHGGDYMCPDCSIVVGFDTTEFQGFEVMERLGSGSAGLVFKARQLVLGRIVALKVLRRRQSLSPRTEARFLREASTIARLDHPHIVKVFDASPFPGGYFIVMEYFKGADLQGMIEDRGVPSVAVSLSIGLQMCEALRYAAAEGIIHRDVKPANILYRADDGVAKLSDFGLAKRVGVSTGTRDGEGVGTPCYMPPEQLNDARNVDNRADVYSLGATLYHLLSGRFPIIADNLHEFMESILQRDPPPVEKINPKVPVELGDVVRVAMRKKADERFQDFNAFGRALENVRLQYRIPAPPRLER
jgi:tRNA A-37 threonylcarbamoyl transferase component Bud32